MITIYTDGTITSNPGGTGRGGWIRVGEDQVHLTKIYSGPTNTNNRMELMGIIDALINQPDDSEITIFTDSQYCVKVFKKPGISSRNRGLVMCLKEAALLHKNVIVKWVRGHDGNKYNEMVDKAIKIRRELKRKKRTEAKRS